MFRRRKIAQNGIDLFKQEYPAEPDEAFLTTGRPVFNPEQLTEVLAEAKDPLERLALEGDEFVHNRRGELTTYIKHDPGERYVIGAQTLMAVTASQPHEIINRISIHRDSFYRELFPFDTFGRGWKRRNDETREQAINMGRG